MTKLSVCTSLYKCIAVVVLWAWGGWTHEVLQSLSVVPSPHTQASINGALVEDKRIHACILRSKIHNTQGQPIRRQ